MDELRDAEINPNCIFKFNVFDRWLLRVARVVFYDDADAPATCFFFLEDDLCDVCVSWEWSVVVDVEVTDFTEVHACVVSSARVTIHVKTGLIVTNAAKLVWFLPLQLTDLVASVLERFEYALALFDAPDGHLQALRIDSLPLGPALFPARFAGELVLQFRIGWFIASRTWPILLCKSVIIHFPTRLNVVPCSRGCRVVVRRCDVLERLLNHYSLVWFLSLERSESHAVTAVSPTYSLPSVAP